MKMHRHQICGAVLCGLLALAEPSLVHAEVPIQPAQGSAAEQAAPATPAVRVIRTTVDAALAILRDPSLRQDPEQRRRKLREAVDPAFDWEAMAKSSLGQHWRGLDEKQRREFVSVFKELLAREYLSDIDRFQGSEQVDVKGSEKKGDLEVVKTVLITASREQVPIDYTLHAADGSWRVEDVAVEGVSLVAHYRATLGRFLVNGDFASLLQQLKRKLGLS
jgi:phospholipid transport system substrate-binding protein